MGASVEQEKHFGSTGAIVPTVQQQPLEQQEEPQLLDSLQAGRSTQNVI